MLNVRPRSQHAQRSDHEHAIPDPHTASVPTRTSPSMARSMHGAPAWQSHRMSSLRSSDEGDYLCLLVAVCDQIGEARIGIAMMNMRHPSIRGKLMRERGVIMLLFFFSEMQHQCFSAFSLTAPRTVPGRGNAQHTARPRRRQRSYQHQSSIVGVGAPFPTASSSSNPAYSVRSASAAARGKHGGELRAQDVDTVEQREVDWGPKDESDSTAPDTSEQTGFQWKRQWYPVAVMRDLEARDPRKPYPVQLMGEGLVVWKDPKDGGWKAFADRCPHRWAPLSEGRVDQESGRLQCIYHGWEFEGDGTCGSIPQAAPGSRETAQNSKRACATAIPTKVVEGKLWLWPDPSPEGVKESETVPPATVPGLDFGSGDFGGNWYCRKLAYGFDTLIENLADPAHVPFAHHGVMGSRAMGTPMAIEMDKEAGSGEDEFVTKKTGYAGSNVMRVGFKAPGLIYYESDYTETLGMTVKRLAPPFRAIYWLMTKLKIDKRISMKDEDRKEKSDRLLSYFVGYAVPTSPGKCMIFTRTARNFFLQHPVIPRRFRNSIAKEHLGQHLVLDGDSPALHIQERLLADAGERGVERPEKTYYMPTASDVPVRFFRKWYHSRGGAGPPWAKGVDPTDLGPILPREEVLDRMDAHTKDCSACSKAFRVSGAVKRLSAGSTLVLLGAAAAVPRGLLPVGLVGGALASAGLAVAMSKRQQQFVFLDYVHAERD